MGRTFSILEVGMRGVDMRLHPFFPNPRNKKFTFAHNISFEEGDIKTRYGVRFHDLGIAGKLQDAKLVNLGKGISRGRYGHDIDVLVIVAGGKAYYLESQLEYCDGDTQVAFCEPKPICDLSWGCDDHVRIGQVEDRVVFYGHDVKTKFWDGETCRDSLGYEERDCEVDQRCHDADSFCPDEVKNEIPHNICHLEYIHGRAHAGYDNEIHVGDMIHRRWENGTEDAIKFNEQAHDSFGDPLGIPTRMGSYINLSIYPAMGTTYGEGDLIGYTSGGIVRHNTYKYPRDTRYDEGKLIQKGWKFEQMVVSVANTVTATGINAVTVTPRDHFFASDFGVHFLSQVTGEGSFNDETTKTLSQDIEPMYRWDSPALTYGRSTGHWLQGSRYFVTIGHFESDTSTLPPSKGYASMNQATTFTEDRTPIPSWEGLHTPPEGISVHKFMSSSLRPAQGAYGYLASSEDGKLYFAEMRNDLTHDLLDDEKVAINWEVTTGQQIFDQLRATAKIDSGVLQYITDDQALEIEVQIRTSDKCCWEKWRTVKPCPDKVDSKGRVVNIVDLKQPPSGYRESSWFQVRLVGKGYVELRKLDVYTETGTDLVDSNAKGCKCAGERHLRWDHCLLLPERGLYRKTCICGKALKKDEPCNCTTQSRNT